VAASLEQRAAGRGADLVLEGGGVRGIALAGAVVGLAEGGVVFPRIAGTSAGSIVAALTVAYQIAGFPLSRLRDDLDALDLLTLESQGPLERATGPIGKAGALLTRSGLYRTDRLRSWLSERLAEAGVVTFRDLKITTDPGTDLLPQQRYRLVTHVTDLTRRSLVRVPWDLPHYLLPEGTEASVPAQVEAIDAYPVVDAVVASASLPFFFQPFRQATPEGACTWVDGGLLQYFPITVFDRTDGRTPRWPTWGVRLRSRAPAVVPDKPVVGPLSEGISLLETAIGEWNRYALADEGVDARTVNVDTSGVSATDFGIDDATRKRLYDNGHRAAQAFLASGARLR
jgi:NTE family protein